MFFKIPLHRGFFCYSPLFFINLHVSSHYFLLELLNLNKVTMDELVEYLMDDPQDEAGRPKVVKMPGNVTPNGSSRYSHASEADSYRGNPFAANAEAKSGKDMAFTTNAADRTAAQVCVHA
jgi:hypothetical protein